MGTAAGSSAGGKEGGTGLQHSRTGNEPLPQGRVGSRGERGRSLLRRCRATTNLSPEALTSPSSSPGFPLLTAASPGWVMVQSPPRKDAYSPGSCGTEEHCSVLELSRSPLLFPPE